MRTPCPTAAGGQRRVSSVYTDALAHLTQGLALLEPLPDTPARAQQELAADDARPGADGDQGRRGPEVERVYTRARELCERVGEPAELFRVLWGMVSITCAGSTSGPEPGEELLSLAQRIQDPDLLLEAHHALWAILLPGEPAAARLHLDQGLRLYDPQRHRFCTRAIPGTIRGSATRGCGAIPGSSGTPTRRWPAARRL